MERINKLDVNEKDFSPKKEELPKSFYLNNFNDNVGLAIEYTGNTENVNPEDIEKARKMIVNSLEYIKENADTPVERKTTETLISYYESNKIVLCDTTEIFGRRVYGAFCFEDEKNPYIVIDLDNAIDYGTAELIDTLFHEGYHAAQFETGHKNDIIKEETKAWNLGLKMANEYRLEHGETIVRSNPYTEREIRNDLGYANFGNREGFTEIC